MQVEPRQIPFLTVLKIIGKHLRLRPKGSGQGGQKEHGPDAKLHLGLFFGKNSDFVAISFLLAGKSRWLLFILIKVRWKNRVCCGDFCSKIGTFFAFLSRYAG
jgi:hypothetical protein